MATTVYETTEIELLDGTKITVTEGGQSAQILLLSLPLNSQGYALMAEETYDPPTTGLDADGQGTPYAVYGFGAQMAELQVDPDLGTVKLIKSPPPTMWGVPSTRFLRQVR